MVATLLSHHNPPTPDLQDRLRPLGVEVLDDLTTLDTSRPTRVVARHLIVGGARSGKSMHAERLAGAYDDVTYVATGGTRDGDAEWADRVARHRARRPSTWRTLETTDVARVLRTSDAGSVVLVDCLSLWLTAQLDELDAWRRLDDGETGGILDDVGRRIDDLMAAITACPADVILVSNEVGQGVVPPTASGRLFRDAMGTLNARTADACTRSTFMVAGRALPLGALDAH